VTAVSYGKLRRYVASLLVHPKGGDGQALGEFTLVLALVALAAVVALTALGVAVSGFYENFAGLIGG
jgi:Flp pilus assembly pilin Flp